MIRFSTNSFSWNTTYNVGLPELDGPDICRQAAACGAEGIEIDPSRVTAADLGEIGLALSGASTGGPLFDDWTIADADKVVATAAATRALGGEYVFFTAAPKGGWGAHEPVAEDHLKLAGERLTALAARVRAEGLAIGLHNHASDPDGLAAELGLLRDHVDRALVGLYLDLGWAYCGEADPAEVIAEFGPRLMGLHFRNHSPDKVPTQTLSEGALDLAAIAAAIRASGYEGWAALELWHRQDVPVSKGMLECQRESLAAMRELLG
jgi:sugar phosphate isomerase/epimerase